MAQGECRLCGLESDLKLSHFIPKFVGKWVKETSATGFIRLNQTINKRSQDIAKDYWLCESCEQLFSGWEREFASKVFYPIVKDESDMVSYGDWMAKFCASLSWRTLSYMRHKNPRTDKVQNECEEAILVGLSSFLLGRSNNPGVYEQHIYPLDTIDDTSVDLPGNINRYFLRTMQMDVLGGGAGTLILTKLPKFIILGLAGHPESKEMRSSRVAIGSGKLSPRSYYWPKGFAQYLFGKAREISNLYRTMNSSQHEMIKKSLANDPERALTSGTFAALRHDIDMFGQSVFSEVSNHEEK